MIAFWITVSSLLDRISARARTGEGDQGERGALTLEWIVIAGLLVVAALGALVLFEGAIKTAAADMTKGL